MSCALAQVPQALEPPPPVSPETGAPPPALRVEPRVLITQTLNDISGASGRTASLTQISPGLRVTSRRGRVQGQVDYSLEGVIDSASSDDGIRHLLDAAVTAELIERRLFVDVQASIARRPISAFGQQTADPALANPNLTDQRKFSIAPVLRGSIAGEVDYLARVAHAVTRSAGSDAFDSDISSALLRLSGGTPLRGLGWVLEGTNDIYDFRVNRKTESKRVSARAAYAITPSLQVALIGGRESNDLRTLQPQTYNNAGWLLDWRPSERTHVFAQQERRFFGMGFNAFAEYRTARTTWRASDRRDISTPQEQRTLAAVGTFYDLFFAQFAALEPDPVLRDVLVTNFLRVNGINPRTPVFGGFLTSSVTLTRDQQLSFAWRGLRDTITLLWQQTWTRRADTLADAPDDFSNTALVHQRGLSLNVSHRMTPLSTLSLLVQYLRTRGDFASQDSNLRSMTVSWSEQLGERTTATLGLRHSQFDSSSQPYRENAVIGTLLMRF